MDALFVLPTMAAGGGERQFVTLARGLKQRGFEIGAVITGQHGDHLRDDFEEFLLAEPFKDHGEAAAFVGMCLDARTPRAIVFHENDVAVRGLAEAEYRPPVVALIKHTVWENDANFATRPDISAAVTDYICVSEDNAHHLRGFGVGEERIHSIRNGVDPEFIAYPEGREQARADLGIPQDAFVVLHIGRLTDGKGTGLSVMALAHLPMCYGLFVGWGDQQDMLMSVAGRYHMLDRVKFEPAVSDPRRFYAAANVLLLPTKAEGGIPYAVMEAAYAGIAVASTPVSDIPALFGDGAYLQIERNVAHIQQVLMQAERDRVGTATVAARGQTIARLHLTAERMTAQYEEVLFGASSDR